MYLLYIKFTQSAPANETGTNSYTSIYYLTIFKPSQTINKNSLNNSLFQYYNTAILPQQMETLETDPLNHNQKPTI